MGSDQLVVPVVSEGDLPRVPILVEVEGLVYDEPIEGCLKILDYLGALLEDILDSDGVCVVAELQPQPIVLGRGQAVTDEVQNPVPIEVHEDDRVV